MRLALACVVLSLAVACRSNPGSSPTAPASASPVASATAPVASADNSARAPELPAAGLSFHLVAKSSGPLTLDVITNAALVHTDPARDALLLDAHGLKALPGLFASVIVPKDWSFGPLDGHWPDLLLLTLANRGYRGYAKDAKVLRRSGTSFSPLPGALASSSEFVLLTPPNAKPLLLVLADKGAHFVTLDGKSSELSLENEIDGEKFHVTEASVDDKGQIFVSGFIHEPPKQDAKSGLGLTANSAGGVDGGLPVIQRLAPGAKKPSVERIAGDKPLRTDELFGGGVFSAGAVTFALFGASHAIGRFENGRWSVESLPIHPSCSGVRDFSLAKDGTIFFGTTDDPTPGDAHYRRGLDGNYTKVAMPPDVNVSGLYAESADDVWIVASDAQGAGKLFYTKPLGDVVTLSGPRPAP